MSSHLTPIRVADDVFEFSVADTKTAQALAAKLRKAFHVEDVVAGIETVSLRFHPQNIGYIIKLVDELTIPSIDQNSEQKITELSIVYAGDTGPDFEWVCERAGLSESEFIDLHTSIIHVVEIIGFTPGFSYMSGLPQSLSIPRLDNPRPRVPAGSIGISGAYTGTYALPGPGGWPIIGKTEDTLFDENSSDPFKLSPGQRVRFKAR